MAYPPEPGFIIDSGPESPLFQKWNLFECKNRKHSLFHLEKYLLGQGTSRSWTAIEDRKWQINSDIPGQMDTPTVGAVSHQSSMCLELLMLDSPTVHVPLLVHKSLNSKQDRRGGGGYLQRLSDA
ncbi:hypothetical protein PanWU01x14_111070 [Parasponia andersonii]|uniref:Uncharacterized protein n=1 Tax=Parasponia andersonii TaxID=3476 RepID=A0A2P5CYY6_PARAD|nr:hypothetical protein PanWU01x14_111070 [Parasponia andersonii]